MPYHATSEDPFEGRRGKVGITKCWQRVVKTGIILCLEAFGKTNRNVSFLSVFLSANKNSQRAGPIWMKLAMIYLQEFCGRFLISFILDWLLQTEA